MCGIVGYIGERDCVPIIIEGLKRLEYRGYDSSGLTVLSRNKLKTHKKAGKIIVKGVSACATDSKLVLYSLGFENQTVLPPCP